MKRQSLGEKVFGGINALVLLGLALVTLYPFWYVVMASLSDPVALMSHSGLLLKPIKFTLNAYKKVLSDPEIYTGYANTLFYVVAGTLVNVMCTSIAAYCLSRKNLVVKKAVMLMTIFTMYFGGGLLPNYFLMRELGLINNRLVLIIPGAVSVYHMLIMIRAFEGVPDSLEEAARLDGAGDLSIFFRVMLPLVKPTIMVIMLYSAVGIWNSWFSASIYLRERDMMPLQLFLREILIQGSAADMTDPTELEDIGTTIKYATIMVTTLPILCVYPFIQKHFVKGVLVGAVKQ